MAKRKACVNDIIYELDNDDIELSSDDESNETKIRRTEDDIQKKQRKNVPFSRKKGDKRYIEVIQLDCSSDGPCDLISPNTSENGGKTTQSDDSPKSYSKNQNDVDDSKKNDEDLQNNTLLFNNHNIVVDSPSYSDCVVGCENRTPLVTVRFKDKELAHTYKKRVREFLINLLKSQHNHHVDLLGDSDVEIDIWPEDLFEEEFNKIREVPDFTKDVATEEFDNDSEVDDSLFFVDTAPCDNSQNDIPKYRQNSSIITNVVEEDTTSSPATFRKGPICFNCDGAHQLKDCELPRNHNRIAANRKNMIPRIGRYHVEDEQKYGHLVPGRISGSLRHALGLKRYELPLHIYRMRLLGYPPGWLEEARVSHSGITLFDSTGNATLDPEEEDGELCEPGSKDKFDIKKILDFPGFNVPASSRYIEEAHLYGLPPMSEQDSKIEMLEALAPNAMKAYKRKKLTFFPSANQNYSLEGQAEMELDSGDEIAEFPSIPPLPDEAPPPQPPPPPPPPSEPPPEETPSPVNSDKSPPPSKISDKSKNTDESVANNNNTYKNGNDKSLKGFIGKENLTNKNVSVDNAINLASSSDDELQVVEVVQVTDIPVPADDIISIEVNDDDKLQLSSGPNSPSLAALEARKKRLLDALTGDSDVSMELVVLDETFSDSTDDGENGNDEKPELNGKTDLEKGNSETDIKEISTSNKEPEKCVTIEVDDESLPTNEDMSTLEAKTCEKSSNKNGEYKNTETVNSLVEKSSTVNEEENTNVEIISISNEEVKSAEKSVIDEVKIPDQITGLSHVENESSRLKEVNTTDPKTGQVKNTSYGTPIINVLSPYDKLPSDDKFSKNICDVLNFENLPNSTGKFKQISSLLKKVKSAVDRIQDS